MFNLNDKFYFLFVGFRMNILHLKFLKCDDV